jgi:hypothetical protein
VMRVGCAANRATRSARPDCAGEVGEVMWASGVGARIWRGGLGGEGPLGRGAAGGGARGALGGE